MKIAWFESEFMLPIKKYTLFMSSGAEVGSDGFAVRQFDFSSDSLVKIILSC